MELRRELNEKVIFWSNAFGFGNWGVYSNDDKGRGKRQYCSTATNSIFTTTGVDSAAGDVYLRRS